VVRELDHPLILKTYPPICDGELAVLPMRLVLAKNPRHRPQSLRGVIIGLSAALDEPMTREDRILSANARELTATPVVTPEC